MAFYEFTSSSVLYASQMNELMKQSMIQTADSSEYPDSSHRREGMFVYDMEAHALKQFTTGATGWTAPWNLPWGYVAQASTSTVTSAISSTYKDITDLTVTWTGVANRRYKVTGYVDIGSTNSSISRIAITDGSNTEKAQSQQVLGSNDVATHNVMEIFTGTSASLTRKLRGRVTAGTGATQSNNYGPHLIVVEDIGPVLNTGPA